MFPLDIFLFRLNAFRNEMILTEKLRGVPLGNVPNKLEEEHD